jgi:hypothetical protein
MEPEDFITVFKRIPPSAHGESQLNSVYTLMSYFSQDEFLERFMLNSPISAYNSKVAFPFEVFSLTPCVLLISHMLDISATRLTLLSV